jgi:hypothetical protein
LGEGNYFISIISPSVCKFSVPPVGVSFPTGACTKLHQNPKKIHSIFMPTEDKTDDIKDRFYDEREHVFDKFPKYYMKIL